jgi:hypothetical protein
MSNQKSKHIILSHNDNIPISQIRVKKPYMVNDSISIFDISLDHQPLVIQTAPCVIPYSYHILDNKSFQLDVTAHDRQQKSFLDSLNDHIISKISKYRENIFQGKQHLNYVKTTRQEPELEYRIRLRNIHVNNVSVFDNQIKIIDVFNLQTFDKVICMFQLQKLIVQKETFYFQASIVQIKKMNTPLLVQRECMIDDNENNNENEVKDIIPLVKAVPELQHQILQQIRKGVPLSSQVLLKRTPVSKKVELEKTVCFQPPSLNEILRARTNLKPIL